MKDIWTTDNIPDLAGKIIVITGANSGIGFESAKEFARKGAEVIFACRNKNKAEAAIQKLLAEIPGSLLTFIELNLANLQTVRRFTDSFMSRYDRLDILLNNAGIMMVPYGITEDGFERQFGTNHLGHFALTGLLNEYLLQIQGSRVVNVSSNAHYSGSLDFDDLMYQDRNVYSPQRAYSISKLANLLFTYELQRRFENNPGDAIAAAAHPGISATGLADHFFNNSMTWLIRPMMRIMFQSSAMGALPSLRAAVDPSVIGGQYYGPDGRKEQSGNPVVVDSNAASKNLEVARKLWEISQELTGVSFLV